MGSAEDAVDVIVCFAIRRVVRKHDLAFAVRLSGTGAKTHGVASAEEAIRYLEGREPYSDRTRYPSPNAIILGLTLSGMSGLDFLSWRRSSPFLPIPCVVLTGFESAHIAAKAFELGALAVMRKPVSFEQLLSLVIEMLKVLASFGEAQAGSSTDG